MSIVFLKFFFPNQKSGLSTGAVIGIVAAVVVVIAVIVAVVLKKKKK